MYRLPVIAPFALLTSRTTVEGLLLEMSTRQLQQMLAKHFGKHMSTTRVLGKYVGGISDFDHHDNNEVYNLDTAKGMGLVYA